MIVDCEPEVQIPKLIFYYGGFLCNLLKYHPDLFLKLVYYESTLEIPR